MIKRARDLPDQRYLAIIATLAGLAAGACEPIAGSPSATPERPAKPVAATDVAVKLDDTKLGPDHKYMSDGDLRVSGLFSKDGAAVEQLVKVFVEHEGEKVKRRYEIELTDASLGATADVTLDDGAVLSVALPRTKADSGRFSTRPERVKATALRDPSGRLSMCLVGKDTLQGGLHFVVCGVGLPGAHLSFGFIDAERPEAIAGKQ